MAVTTDITKAVKELAEWIDPEVLAGVLIMALAAQGVEPTVENGKKAWLDILENSIGDAVESAVKFAPAFAPERSIFEEELPSLIDAVRDYAKHRDK